MARHRSVNSLAARGRGRHGDAGLHLSAVASRVLHLHLHRREFSPDRPTRTRTAAGIFFLAKN